MGAGASVVKDEVAKPADGSDVETPEAAKAEVARLRKLLAENSQTKAEEPAQVGECFCGKVKVEVQGKPLYHAVCHCESCRLWTGTYAMNMLVFPIDKVNVSGGDIIEHTRAHKENNQAVRKCCAECGTSLYVNHSGKVGLVSAALFPDANFPLQGHMCTPEAQYCSMGDDLPKYKAGPPELGYPGDKFGEEFDAKNIGNKEAGFLYEGNNDFADGATGSCYCGEVKIKCEGAPMKKLVCSCRSCQHWTGGFANAGCIYVKDKVTIEGETRSYCKNPDAPMPSHRTFCVKCGGNVMNAHPSKGLLDVCSGTLNAYPFKPDLFVQYGDKARPFSYIDGVPKFKDLPKPFGGSHILLDEATGAEIGEAPEH